MSDMLWLTLLYAAGVLILVAEVFIPSHGLLTVIAVGCLIGGIVQTFRVAGQNAGVVAIIACTFFLPTFALVAVKFWHRTPMGKRISPPNPVLTAADSSVPVVELAGLIGQRGRAVTMLRPVGIGDFQGRRVSCIAQIGVIDAGAVVEGADISGGDLVVIERRA